MSYPCLFSWDWFHPRALSSFVIRWPPASSSQDKLPRPADWEENTLLQSTTLIYTIFSHMPISEPISVPGGLGGTVLSHLEKPEPMPGAGGWWQNIHPTQTRAGQGLEQRNTI